jgi:hypothetical protein
VIFSDVHSAAEGKELDHQDQVSLLRRAGCAQADHAGLCAPVQTDGSLHISSFPNVPVCFGDITQCCALGAHWYFFSLGDDPEQR